MNAFGAGLGDDGAIVREVDMLIEMRIAITTRDTVFKPDQRMQLTGCRDLVCVDIGRQREP